MPRAEVSIEPHPSGIVIVQVEHSRLLRLRTSFACLNFTGAANAMEALEALNLEVERLEHAGTAKARTAELAALQEVYGLLCSIENPVRHQPPASDPASRWWHSMNHAIQKVKAAREEAAR